MRGVSDFRRRAAVYRVLAARYDGAERERLLGMANGWDSLCDFLLDHPALAADLEAD